MKHPLTPPWQPTARTQAGRAEILALMTNARARGWAQSMPVQASSPPRSKGLWHLAKPRKTS